MTPEILAFLAGFYCSPEPVAIVTDPGLPRPGLFNDGTVYLHPAADDGVLVHELVHVCQWQERGNAATKADIANRERQARRIELAWRRRDA